MSRHSEIASAQGSPSWLSSQAESLRTSSAESAIDSGGACFGGFTPATGLCAITPSDARRPNAPESHASTLRAVAGETGLPSLPPRVAMRRRSELKTYGLASATGIDPTYGSM